MLSVCVPMPHQCVTWGEADQQNEKDARTSKTRRKTNESDRSHTDAVTRLPTPSSPASLELLDEMLLLK